MAKGVLVPMISGAIERQRQRNENRKNNALLAKTMNDNTVAGAASNVQAAIPQQKTVGSDDFLKALAANIGPERFGMADTKYIQYTGTCRTIYSKS